MGQPEVWRWSTVSCKWEGTSVRWCCYPAVSDTQRTWRTGPPAIAWHEDNLTPWCGIDFIGWICSKGVEYCCKCDVCTEIRGPLQHLVGSPMKHIALDNLGPLTVTKQGNQYLLFIANYFSKWTEAVPMPNQEASTVADLLVKEVICQCQCQCQCFIPVDKDLHIKTSWI